MTRRRSGETLVVVGEVNPVIPVTAVIEVDAKAGVRDLYAGHSVQNENPHVSPSPSRHAERESRLGVDRYPQVVDCQRSLGACPVVGRARGRLARRLGGSE